MRTFLLWILVSWWAGSALAHVTSTGLATLDIAEGKLTYKSVSYTHLTLPTILRV